MGRAMKDSGVEWIGEIPAEWTITNLGRLFNIKAGGDAKPELYSDKKDAEHPFPVYTNATNKEQVYAYTSTPYFDENTITVTGRGEIGRAIYRATKYDAIIRLLSLSPKMELDSRFYAYWIDNVVIFFTNSAAIGQLSAQQIQPYRACVPNIQEQTTIANFLDFKCSSIDSIIEKARTSIKEYKHLKQAVITQAVTKGVRGDRPMKESGIEWIGKIPHEWKVGKLSYFVDSITDVDHYMPNSVDEGFSYLMTGNLQDRLSMVNFDGCKKISNDDFELLTKKSKIKKGNVIFARYATIGTVCYVDIMKECVVSYSCVNISPCKSLNGLFLYYYLKSTSFSQDVQRFINSNTQGNIGIESLKHARIVIPSLHEQLEIAVYLEKKCAEIDALIAKKEQFLTELESYKKSLIYEYVTGKKEVCK